MNLHVYEVEGGWRWAIDQDQEIENDDPDTVAIGSSNTVFQTEQAALENAKDLALGILDAFASRAIGAS